MAVGVGVEAKFHVVLQNVIDVILQTLEKVQEAIPAFWRTSVENGEFCQDRVYLKLVQNVMFLTKVRGEFVKGKEWNFTFSTL